MRLRVNPFFFILRLVVFLLLTYGAWRWIEPYYLRVLLPATRAGVWLSELSLDPAWRAGTTVLTKETGTGIFFRHRNFAAFSPPLEPQGIPGDWIMANMVLLVALMLATPAPSWRLRAIRLALALVIVLVLQVLDIVIAIKVTYARLFYGYWSTWSRKFYQFLDAFFQGFDTQLFPFVIWAGIHFRELVAFDTPTRNQERTSVAPPSKKSSPGRERRGQQRDARRTKK